MYPQQAIKKDYLKHPHDIDWISVSVLLHCAFFKFKSYFISTPLPINHIVDERLRYFKRFKTKKYIKSSPQREM